MIFRIPVKYSLLFFFSFWMMGCGPATSDKAADKDTDASDEQVSLTANDSYFSLLKGRVGAYPVTCYLFALHHQYSGYYYYDARQVPIYFSGNDTAMAGKLALTAFGNEGKDETFTLSFDGQKATGDWQSAGKSLPVSLARADVPMAFDYIGMQDSAKLVDTMTASPVATAEISTVWPKGSTATDEFIKQQIALLFDEKNPKKEANEIVQAGAKQFFDEYKSDSNITREDITDFPERLNYDMSNELRIAYLTPRLLVLSFYTYSYMGGAHGNYGTIYRPLDLQHNKVLQLQDILTPEGIRQLRPLLEKSFRQDHHLKPSQPLDADGYLFEKKIEPNDNFYVTGKGLVFSYNPYEIGPYAVGEITIMIDYTALQPYLQTGFSELLR